MTTYSLSRAIAAAMKKHALVVLRHAVVHTTGVNFLIVGVTTLASVSVARSLGAEGRGYYAAIMAWFALAQVLGEIGQSGAVTFWVAQDPLRRRDYVATSRLLMLGIGAMISAIGIGVAPALSGGVESVTITYQITFAGCFLNSVCAAFVYALQAVSTYRWNLVRVSQPIAYLILVVGFGLAGILDLIWLSVALVLSIAAQFMIATIQARLVGLVRGKADRDVFHGLIRYGFAYAASAVPGTLASQYDRLALSKTVPAASLGQYAVASSVASLVSPFATAVSSVVFPRSAAVGQDEVARLRMENRSVVSTALVSVAISSVMAFLAAPLVPLVFGAAFLPAVGLVWWLAPAMVLRAISQVANALLRGRHRPGLASYGQLSVLAVGACAVLPLIGWLGVRGAAVAVGLGEAVGLTLSLLMLARERRRASAERVSGSRR